MNKDDIIRIATDVINENEIALVGTKGSKGYPNIKALTKMKNDGLKTFYFNTKIDSTKVKQMKRHKKGSLYFYDRKNYIGILLEGTFKVENNTSVGVSKLYDLDAIDPYDFCTVIFTTKTIDIYIKYKKAKIKL